MEVHFVLSYTLTLTDINLQRRNVLLLGYLELPLENHLLSWQALPSLETMLACVGAWQLTF